ncbi:MAG: nucleotidyltransferase domain-containing protein [Promethearchaeia archaeon]
MKKLKSIDEVKKDLQFCGEYWTVLYGSYISDYFMPNRSDIDVAVITKVKDKEKNIEIWNSLLGKANLRYDIRIFELFPLYIKIDIINNHKTLFGDPLKISEYFYQYRKKWKDMLPRIQRNQFDSIEEKLSLMKNRKYI